MSTSRRKTARSRVKKTANVVTRLDAQKAELAEERICEGDARVAIQEVNASTAIKRLGAQIQGTITIGQRPITSRTLGAGVDKITVQRLSRPTYDSLASMYNCNEHGCSMSVANTCAIRMSEALLKSNADWLPIFKASGTNFCDNKFVRGAQDLAAIIASSAGWGVWDVGVEDPGGQVPASIAGRSGLAVYMTIPGYDGQGHIGLWKGDRGHCGDSYWNAKRVWFWNLT